MFRGAIEETDEAEVVFKMKLLISQLSDSNNITKDKKTKIYKADTIEEILKVYYA
jgi:hypothetical protein